MRDECRLLPDTPVEGSDLLERKFGISNGSNRGYNEVSVQETALLLTRPAKLHSLSESGGRRAGPYFLKYRVIKEA